MQITGNVFLITGGASGLGAGTVRMIAANGGKAVIADVNESAGNALAQELGEANVFCRTDVTDEASAKAAVDVAVRELGGLR